MRGIIASVLISRPIQARSQCELANVIVVPSPRAIKRTDKMWGFISKGRFSPRARAFGSGSYIYFVRKWCSWRHQEF